MNPNPPDAAHELLYEGEWLRMVRARPLGVRRAHPRQGMAVIVIAVTPADKVLFVEQYRVPLGARTIEMPAGLVGDDHAARHADDAARRELIEETGWHPAQVEVLLVGPTSSGMSNERIAFVRARGLTRGGRRRRRGQRGHHRARGAARGGARWLMRKQAEGFELDLKLWAGLWMIEHNPDGSRAEPVQGRHDSSGWCAARTRPCERRTRLLGAT